MGELNKIPFTIEEMTFAQERGFRANMALFVKKLEAGDSDSMSDLADAIAEATGMSKDFLLNEIPYEIDGDSALASFSLKNGDEVSLLRIYLHIDNVIRSYVVEEPDEGLFSITYKGEHYYMGDKALVKVMGSLELTAGEAIEVMELQSRFGKLQQIFKDNIEGEGVDETAHIDAAYLVSADWNIGLEEVAILLKKDGEKLPINKTKRTAFIKERAEHFRDIPLKDIIDMRFFLIHTLADYLVNHYIEGFGRADLGLENIQPKRKKKLVLNRK